MATDNSTQETAARELHFTAGTNTYQINPGASNIDLYDQLTARLQQLVAALELIGGAGHEYFARIGGRSQAAYLWNCQMLADECYELAGHIDVGRSCEVDNDEAVNHG